VSLVAISAAAVVAVVDDHIHIVALGPVADTAAVGEVL